MYRVEIVPLGIYQANCYLLWKENHVIMIDPGGKSGDVITHIEEANGEVDAILLTHGHFDHIGGADYFANHFHCPIYIDEQDARMTKDIELNCSLRGREVIVESPLSYYKVGKNQINDFSFQVYFCPGHTKGCVMLQFDNLLFSGDVLFEGSIGRCDLPTSSPKDMNQTIAMIKKLDPTLQVFPGHGASTTLKREIESNPYLIR